MTTTTTTTMNQTQQAPPLPFKTVGLTGGIASGKSTVARHLRQAGFPMLDADQVSRQVVEPGSEGLGAVVEAFGQDIVDDAGALNRSALGAIVFADPSARKTLEGILHPRIAAATASWMQAQRQQGVPVIIYEAPLIVENKIHLGLDLLVVVSVEAAVQRERLMQRDDLDAEAAQQRINAQLPLADKIAVADVVIDNSDTIEQALKRTDDFIQSLPAHLWPQRPDAPVLLGTWLRDNAQHQDAP